MDGNLKQMASIEAELQQARATYAASYQDTVLQLKKLQDVKSSLDALSTTPSQRQKELSTLLQTLYSAYGKSQNSNSTTNKVTK